MTAPVPRTADAVRRIISPRVYAVTPVIRIFIHIDDSAAVFSVITDGGCHIVRNQYGVLLVSEQIYLRGFGFFHKSFGLSLVLLLLGFCPDGRRTAVDPVGKPLSVVG